MIGIPYAVAGVDDVGYFVTCPVCGLVCRPPGRFRPFGTEDRVTKDTARVYAAHYADAHPHDCGHLWAGDGGANRLACLRPEGHAGPHRADWADAEWTDESSAADEADAIAHGFPTEVDQ